MSVLDNVALGAHRRGRSGFLSAVLRLDRREEASLLSEAQAQLDRTGLGASARRPAATLALGQQRLLEIARALAADPATLLLDEPAAGLRHAEKQELATLLRSLRAEGMSVLLVEHDMPFVMGLADRIVVMEFRHEDRGGIPGRDPERPARAGSLSRHVRVTALFTAHGIGLSYGKAVAVRDVSLAVGQGQIVTVIGANGAGKTSLLLALMGALPCHGTLSYQGADISRTDLEDRVERGIALVPESRALFGGMSVADNLALGSFGRRGDTRQARREALDMVYALFPRLRERSRQLAATLSGGERQMLALGRALVGRPQFLMLDEPSLGLAPRIVEDVWRTILELRARGLSILLVEQNARAALQIADWGYVMEHGAITLSGSATDLRADARVASIYLGAAA